MSHWGMVAAAMVIGAAPPPEAPPRPGSVSVVVANPEEADPGDAVAGAVGAALARLDYVILPTHARYRMDVALERERVGVATVPVAKGGSAAAPTGLAVTLPSSKKAIVDLVKVTLTLRLVASDTGTTRWQGSAITIRPRGTFVPGRLVDAAFAPYPQTRTTPASVP